jgi:phosphatidylserine decarboxylase
VTWNSNLQPELKEALLLAGAERRRALGGKPLPLPVWDRQGGHLVQEFMDDHPATYDSRPRRSITQWLESRRLYDWLVAAYQNSSWSSRQIEPFISKHHIDMSEFKPIEFRSFAEFFGREFRPGVRKFPAAPEQMGAFSEARYFAWEKIERDQKFPVKGHSLSAERILGSAKRAEPFMGGPVLLARLAPVDYHHNHYPDDGETVDSAWIGGPLWTINWHALLHQEDILFSNHRQVNILQTRHFGHLAFVEVGAMSVGRIQQVHPLETPFSRGTEKSAFKFGGSAVLVFGEPGAWQPSQDLVDNTNKGMETLVRLGDIVATSHPNASNLH